MRPIEKSRIDIGLREIRDLERQKASHVLSAGVAAAVPYSGHGVCAVFPAFATSLSERVNGGHR